MICFWNWKPCFLQQWVNRGVIPTNLTKLLCSTVSELRYCSKQHTDDLFAVKSQQSYSVSKKHFIVILLLIACLCMWMAEMYSQKIPTLTGMLRKLSWRPVQICLRRRPSHLCLYQIRMETCTPPLSMAAWHQSLRSMYEFICFIQSLAATICYRDSNSKSLSSVICVTYA